MEVTAQLVGSIPRGNIRVPPTEFVLLWRLTEHLAESGRADWYIGGVAATCRWLACAAVPSILGGWEPAWAPITRRSGMAHEESIAAELMAAEVAAIRNSGGIKGRPGWLEGTLTTVRWAWGGSTKAPLDAVDGYRLTFLRPDALSV